MRAGCFARLADARGRGGSVSVRIYRRASFASTPRAADAAGANAAQVPPWQGRCGRGANARAGLRAPAPGGIFRAAEGDTNQPGEDMFNWLRGRRLGAEAKRKLLIVQARSEEAIIETHVDNVMEMLDMLAGEIEVDRALEEYAAMMPMEETIAATVTNRVLARSIGADVRGRESARGDDRRFENVFRDGAGGGGGGRKRR
jgi:hypothetical protein